MELMEISFDKCYRLVYGTLNQVIPEDILSKVALAVSNELFIVLYIVSIKSSKTFAHVVLLCRLLKLWII